MKQIQDDIKLFMQTAGQDTPEHPCMVTNDVRFLRAKLILEEALEELEALGVEAGTVPIGRSNCFDPIMHGDLVFREAGTMDLAKLADAICDQIYVSVGTGVAMGFDMEPVWKLVQAANMAKFGDGSYKRPDGKQMKPPGWVAPDAAIRDELLRQAQG